MTQLTLRLSARHFMQQHQRLRHIMDLAGQPPANYEISYLGEERQPGYHHYQVFLDYKLNETQITWLSLKLGPHLVEVIP